MAKELSESEKASAKSVAEDLSKGKITAETIKNFKRLLPPEFFTEPHFGNALLPDDDW